jgi:hypothetical protein
MDIKPVEKVGDEVGVFLHKSRLLWVIGLANVDSYCEVKQCVGPEIGSELLLQKFLDWGLATKVE